MGMRTGRYGAWPFANPFTRAWEPDFYARHARYRRNHMLGTFALAGLAAGMGVVITPYIVDQMHGGSGAGMLGDLWRYLRVEASGDALSPHRDLLAANGGMTAPIAYGTLCIVGAVLGLMRNLWQPYERVSSLRDTRWCTEEDLRKIEAQQQIGRSEAPGIVLGWWPHLSLGERLRLWWNEIRGDADRGRSRTSGLPASARGREIRAMDTVSTLLLGACGTGKSAGLVIPTIVGNDEASQVILDLKPELWSMTGAHKAERTCAFAIDWSAIDHVPMRKVGKGAEEPGRLEPDYDNATFHPRFNPLSPKVVPTRGPDRDTYIDRIARALIPRRKEGDAHLADRGRAALTGLLHAIVAIANDAEALPPEHEGREASLALLVDLMPPVGCEASGGMDPMGEWIRSIVVRVDPSRDGHVAGTSTRASEKLAPLLVLSAKERSTILEMVDEALTPFRDVAIRERTSTCDFTPDDLRGMFDTRHGRVRPLSLYLCGDRAGDPKFGKVTTIVMEVLGAHASRHCPERRNELSGRMSGPYDVHFIMDEFTKLPEMDTVIMGPDLGRSMRASYMLIAQDYGQIERVYGKELTRTIDTTTAIKIVLSQNDAASRRRIIEMAGKTTEPIAGNLCESCGHSGNPFSRTTPTTRKDFLEERDVTDVAPLRHILLKQGWLNRPIRAMHVPFFLHPEMRDVVNFRGSGPAARRTIPDFVHDARVAEHRRTHKAT